MVLDGLNRIASGIATRYENVAIVVHANTTSKLSTILLTFMFGGIFSVLV